MPAAKKLLPKKLSPNDKDKALIKAIGDQDLSAIQTLLASGANVEAREPVFGDTALGVAIKHPSNSLEIVEMLIAAHADVNAKERFGGYSILWNATEGTDKKLPLVNALIKAGAEVNAQGTYGQTALMNAAFGGTTRIVEALIKAGAKIDTADKRGHTALMSAAYKGQIDAVKLLLNANAKIDLKNIHGENALMMAKAQGHFKIVRLLKITSLKLRIRNYTIEFKKHPSYYLFSGVARLAVGVIAAYSWFLALSILTAPLVSLVSYIAPITITILPLNSLLPLIIFAVSIKKGASASITEGNVLLSRFFGEIKLTASTVGTLLPKPKLVSVITPAVVMDNPFMTPLSEIVDQLEKSLRDRYKYSPTDLANSRTYALAYARELVNEPKHAHLFDSAAKAEANTEPYVSAAAKIK
jgi:hypothetical protein